MASIKWEYTLTFIFAICSVLLLVLIVVQTQYSAKHQAQLFHEIENVKSAGFDLQDIPGFQSSEHALDEYSELVERPLFFNERRPIVPGEEETKAKKTPEKKAPDEITFSLIGIINIPGSVYALFQDPKAKPGESKFKRFKQGDDVNGWTIQQINSDHIVISSDAGSEEIKLAKPRIHKAVPKSKKRRKTNPFSRKIKKKE